MSRWEGHVCRVWYQRIKNLTDHPGSLENRFPTSGSSYMCRLKGLHCIKRSKCDLISLVRFSWLIQGHLEMCFLVFGMWPCSILSILETRSVGEATEGHYDKP